MNPNKAHQDFEVLLTGLPPINSISKSEEQTLAQSKSEEDKSALVLGHMREAFFYARQCCRAQISEREIYSICYKALCESVRLYKPDWQRFFAYAKPNIRGNISRYWKSLDVVRNASIHETDLNDHALMEEMLDEKAKSQNDHSGADAGHEVRSLTIDYVEPDFEGIDFRERLALVKKAIDDKLNEQEKMVIELSCTGGYNFEQIGQLLEPRVSRSAVQQTHERAVKKLRGELGRRKQLF
jgi:RNA polymerase sigma factor (sigma-70 family)